MNQNITIVCGTEQLNPMPLQPYSDIVCVFLDAYSSELRKDVEAKRYPDVMTFAFWARRGSIYKHREEYEAKHKDEERLGKGIIFHIAPSNVPVNSMYTYAFGLLSGNACIVRIPSKEFPQIVCMCRVLNKLLNRDEFHSVLERTLFVKYDRMQFFYTEKYSGMCDMRVIWGGDETIRTIRRAELPPRSTEITFSDRYSFGIIDVQAVLKAEEQELKELAEHFYNDTYLMDQNACSAPHLICWKESRTTENRSENNCITDACKEIDRDRTVVEGDAKQQMDRQRGLLQARTRFWNAVYDVAGKYELADIKASEKFAMLCEKTALLDDMVEVIQEGNLLYRCRLDNLSEDIILRCRGRYGLFFEYVMDSYDELQPLSNTRVQTCAIYGIDACELKRYIVEHGFRGIDRIVPFGKTLEIDTIWDGYDLISTMSRVVSGV